jgi:hypothetical protein
MTRRSLLILKLFQFRAEIHALFDQSIESLIRATKILDAENKPASLDDEPPCRVTASTYDISPTYKHVFDGILEEFNMEY